MKRRLIRIVISAAALGALIGASPAPDAEQQAVLSLFRQLVQIDTSNAPGDTRPVAALLGKLCDEAGIQHETILAPNGRAAHFIARLKGSGSKRPLLLAAHADVVPVERDQWSVDPFAGVVRDGYLYGRGTIDNKGAVVAFLRAMLRLKASGERLSRDVILLVEADEEQGRFNTNWLAARHWDKIDAGLVLNEGGVILKNGDRVSQVTVTYADKLTANIAFSASGKSGHSSRPFPVGETANGKLVRALDRLMQYHFPVSLDPELRRYLESVAQSSSPDYAAAIRTLLAAPQGPQREAAAEQVIAIDQGGWGIEGLLRNTLVVTMLKSGIKPNVIPGTAEAIANARLMPGTNVRAFLAALQGRVGQDVKVRLSSDLSQEEALARLEARSAMAPSSLDTPLFAAIRHSAARYWPGARVIPTLFTASTDATPWRVRGVPVYGIAPFPVSGTDMKSVHGDDERIGVSGLATGSDYVFGIVREVAR